MQKLGQNSGGYQGEVIDITAVLHDIEDAARRTGWLFEPIPVTERSAAATARR